MSRLHLDYIEHDLCQEVITYLKKVSFQESMWLRMQPDTCFFPELICVFEQTTWMDHITT